MEEIIIKKISIYKTKIEAHLFETIYSFVAQHKDTFVARSWDCNLRTSLALYSNILHGVDEFKYIKKTITDKIEKLYHDHVNKNVPFYIESSWINILENHGYQEFHNHGKCNGSGVLYLSENNSPIEFAVFPEDTRKKITPEKGDLLLFDATTFHRVLESDKERLSLAFNFIGNENAT